MIADTRARCRLGSASVTSCVFVLLACLVGTGPAAAQIGLGGGVGGPGAEDVLSAGSNLQLTDVTVELRGPAAAASSEALKTQALKVLGFSPGDQFNDILAQQGLARVRGLEGVAHASYRVVRTTNPSGRTLVLTLTTRPSSPAGGPAQAEAQVSTSFPVLYQDKSTLFRVLLNGGVGVFSDTTPWFGNPFTYTRLNPLVQSPAAGAQTGRTASWIENYVEYGLGGATQLGSSPFYVYGAGTFVTVMSTGQDIFRDDARSTTNVEKLYAGLIYADSSGGPRVNISVGRQNFTLNDGFLVAQHGSQWNAGPRPGVYLAPRTTHDFAALATVKWDQWTWTNFYLNPNEYEPIESNTNLTGTNLRYNVTKRFFGDLSYLYVPQSDTRYTAPDGTRSAREGLRTYAGHIRWADPSVVDGLWLESEAARQTHDDFDMDARAAYGTVGFLARALPWTPSLSYRYAYFSGDNPNTRTYERFDSLYSGGLNEWLQGITINKALSQPNRVTHRIRFNVAPGPRLNLTLDYYRHEADEFNNRGGNPALSQLQSKDLGHEVQLATRWAISDSLYFLGIASHAMPGDALKLATPDPDKAWSTVQAQLFWNF